MFIPPYVKIPEFALSRFINRHRTEIPIKLWNKCSTCSFFLIKKRHKEFCILKVLQMKYILKCSKEIEFLPQI